MGDARPDAVCVAVLHGEGQDARLLLIRRRRGVFSGCWTPVMGGIEDGERAPDAALRELTEETALHAVSLYLAGAFDTFYDPRRDAIVNVAMFVARVEGSDVVVDDAHDAYMWVTLEEAEERLEFPSHRHLVADLRRDFVERQPSAWRKLR